MTERAVRFTGSGQGQLRSYTLSFLVTGIGQVNKGIRGLPNPLVEGHEPKSSILRHILASTTTLGWRLRVLDVSPTRIDHPFIHSFLGRTIVDSSQIASVFIFGKKLFLP